MTSLFKILIFNCSAPVELLMQMPVAFHEAMINFGQSLSDTWKKPFYSAGA